MKNTKGRFPNITIYLLAIVVIIFAVKTVGARIESGISIVAYAPFLFGLPAIVIGSLSIIFLSYFLITKKEFLRRFRFIVKIILLAFACIYLLEFTLLSFFRAIEHAAYLNRIPDRSEFLNSMAYIVIDFAGDFFKGVVVTLQLSLIGTIIGLILALIFVIFRTQNITNKDSELMAFLKKVGIVFSKTYVNVFRGTPMMVQAMIIYYLIPYLIATQLGIEQTQVDRFFTITIAAIVVVSLNTTAYLTEVLRGGIESIDKGQLEAA